MQLVRGTYDNCIGELWLSENIIPAEKTMGNRNAVPGRIPVIPHMIGLGYTNYLQLLRILNGIITVYISSRARAECNGGNGFQKLLVQRIFRQDQRLTRFILCP